MSAKYNELDKKVAVMEALTPYKEKLMMAYVNEKTCRCIYGVVGLPNATTTVLEGANPFGCNCGRTTTTTTTGA